MNIGSLIRGLLGEQKPGDAKTLDMKPGQVVRGVVMNVSEDGQEAVVQIQGVQVKAKLETPLRPGETALLQVQPPEEGGTPVLKPLSLSPGQTLSLSSMIEVLEFAGLPDTKENREMIRAMQAAGVPLTKESLAQFKEALALKPPQIPAAEWAEAAAIAFHRGLPITTESLRGLQQAIFGPQLHQLLQSLEEQLGHTLQAGQAKGMPAAGAPGATGGAGTALGAAGKAPPPAEAPGAGGPAVGANPAAAGALPQAALPARDGQALLAKLQGLLHQLRAELAQQGPGAGAAQRPAQNAASGMAAPAAGQGADVPAGTSAKGAPPPPAQAALPQRPTHGGEPWVGRLLKLLGAEHEQQVLRGALPPAPSGAAASAPGGTAAAPGGGPAAVPLPQSGGAGPGQAAAAAMPASAAPPADAAVPGRGTTGSTAAVAAAAPPSQGATGEENASAGSQTSGQAQSPAVAASGARTPHEAGQPSAALQPPGGQSAGERQALTQAPPQPTQTAAVNSAASETQETLKGLLLQMAGADDIPPALKEVAQQVVQHMTGQQLLLNTDRTAPFAQVTLFIPLHGPDGEQTASVHIQSRRGRKGELDPTNCRLWFDLEMKHLGHTVIDVHVVDRIVSLQMRNDNAWAGELFESKREELAAAVESIGYQLLSMKTGPLPEPSHTETEHPVGSTAGEYTPQVYKGVDVRI